MDQVIQKTKIIIISVAVGLFMLIASGILWFFLGGSSSPIGFGWYLFSFAAGLTMIVLPCTLPLAFVIVPLSMGKGIAKGFAIVIAFSAGVTITLSMYGVVTALVGNAAITGLGASLEIVKNWLYFIAGIFAYIFALGELGLVKFRMPTYSGAYPMFIQRQKDVFKALLLGLFLGNIGIGCPHPATPVILTRIAVSGDVFYGWSLFLVHAIGRVLPLLFLAILGIIGVNALSSLVKHKEKIERATGWGMVFVAGFILVLGLFGHDWWINSGQHTFFEEVVQEERFTGIIASKLNVINPHRHGFIENPVGILSIPWQLGNWLLVLLWIAPFWWHYIKKKKTLATMPDAEKEVWKDKLPTLLWNYILLSAFLLVVFVYLLPFRFHTISSMPHMDAQEAMAHQSVYQEESDVKEGIAVDLFSLPDIVNNEPVMLNFFVNKKPDNIPVQKSDLQINKEKIMHVIGTRQDLTEFFHIHPNSADSNSAILTVDHIFNKVGKYKIWSEIKYKEIDYIFGHQPIIVTGANTVLELDKEVTKSKIVSNYQVSAIYDHLHIGDNRIGFSIKDAQGKDAVLDNYLGEKIHLTVIKDDWSEFTHAHPESHMDEDDHHMDSGLVNFALAHEGDEEEKTAPENQMGNVMPGKENDIHFNIPLKSAGFYKAFVQFLPGDILLEPGQDSLLAEFWLEVSEKAPKSENKTELFNSIWWRNLLVSLVVIALLSWGVKKYITVGERKNLNNP